MTTRHIDSRYAPQPANIKVELYPTLSEQDGNYCQDETMSRSVLDELLSGALNTGTSNIITGRSASSLLHRYLQVRTETGVNQTTKVALPNFICQSVADATIASGSVPVFFDVGLDTSVPISAADFAIRTGCEVFIWPTYFGDSPRDPEVISRLKEENIAIIYDNAQADLFSESSTSICADLDGDDVAIYSFGKSKLIANQSGGGALVGSEAVVSSLKADLQSLSESERDNSTPTLQLFFSNQEEQLEYSNPINTSTCSFSKEEASKLLNAIQLYRQHRAIHAERYRRIKDALSVIMGDPSLLFLDRVLGTPSVLAVKTPSSDRYELMYKLSRLGIQSTWYYYPINRITRYSQYTAEPDTNCESIANSIVILPFQWKHDDTNVDELIEALIYTGKI